ncbi:Hypothetical protein PHPALM_9321 [Phytophthora palmivora]|uniref:Myb/SANT-like domain-containing protein n=1 Tax=Phytophthora palmivora TaxID=4796 RepID=A0A2P4Y7K6_9STRA|nr:Hypothetical protein PHPALM_9321 [Phytophthora palmivora]
MRPRTSGKRSDSGFKKEAWVAVTAAINQKFGLELVKQQIKSRLQTYTAVSGMLSASGFGWDPVRNVVLVHDDVWEDYVKGNPKWVDYRQTPLTYYNALVELFEGTYATGEHAITSDEPCPTDFLTGSNAPTPAPGSLSEPTVEASSEAHAPASTTSTSSPPLASAGAPPEQGNQQKI